MNILSMDTSTKTFSLAVSSNEKILSFKHIKLKKVLSQSIMPAIDDILKKSKLKVSQLDGFAVGLGPGSFTSLRVGLSTIKGLSYATQKPVVGISSLEVIASGLEAHDQTICVLCDAKRNLVYSNFYQYQNNSLKPIKKYMLTDLKNILKFIKEDVYFVGDGLFLYEQEIKKWGKVKKLKISFAKESQYYPKARNLAKLALKRFKANKLDKVESLVPMYLYPEDCQVQK